MVFLLVTMLAPGDPGGARAEVERLIAGSGAETVAVAVYDTQSAQSVLINERVSLCAASTMKVPLALLFAGFSFILSSPAPEGTESHF